MRIVHTFWVLALLAALASASQDIDIPLQEYGFTIGDQSGSMHLEFVLDLLCIDSKHQYEQWKQVMKQYPLHTNHIKYTYQFNPLPYHFYAVKITQGFYYILLKYGETIARNYMDYIFDHQDDYAQEEHMDQSVTEFCNAFAQQISEKFGVDLVDFRQAINMGGTYFQKVRNNWKYVAGVMGVPGAPIFYANGVRVDGAEAYTVSDWIDFLKKFKSESPSNIRVE